jgi:hypothetical protein
MTETQEELWRELVDALESIEDANREGRLSGHVHVTLVARVMSANNATLAAEYRP